MVLITISLSHLDENKNIDRYAMIGSLCYSFFSSTYMPRYAAGGSHGPWQPRVGMTHLLSSIQLPSIMAAEH
ncbi:Protein of unknown function [Gryllus bimaculatus]|nr:Protein of unknown function [Gryllus bimaculatus]